MTEPNSAADAASAALSVVLVGSGLSLGPTASAKLAGRARALANEGGFDAALDGLETLVAHPDFRNLVAADNATDVAAGKPAKQATVLSPLVTFTDLMIKAHEGDATARAELMRRAGGQS